jgi:hypothetical protein
MCQACIEYIKGTLTKEEFERAYEEVVLTSLDQEQKPEHDEKAYEKYEKEE